MRKNIIRITAMLLVMVTMLCACGTKDQTFSSNGLIMDLPGNYKTLTGDDYAGFTFAMGSNKSIIVALKEEKALFESYGLNLTLEEYTDLVIEGNGLLTSVKYEGGIPTFSFSKYVNGTYFKYLGATFESKDAFWLVQFACEEGKFDDMYSSFIKYLASVRV